MVRYEKGIFRIISNKQFFFIFFIIVDYSEYTYRLSSDFHVS